MVTWRPESGIETVPLGVAAGRSVRRLGIDGRPVPRLRGRIHQAAAVPLAVMGAVLTIRAATPLEAIAIAVFAVSVVAMLAASAVYHCHSGSFDTKLITRRIDHAMIFVAIAGSQTAYWLLTAPRAVALAALAVIWTIAVLGIHHKVTHLTLTDASGSWLYAVLGWTGVIMLPYLLAAGDLVAVTAVIGGGLVYTAGGLVLTHRAIDPWPGVFGYHEVWHAMVVVGVVAHGAGIVRLTAILG